MLFISVLEILFVFILVEGYFKLILIFYIGGICVLEILYLKLLVMEMDMWCNEIIVVFIDYNILEGIWEIKMFICGEWIMIYCLDIF